ncbi:MAG TPA: GDSL-type esterase/lipase family protein [Povalibacter sp.]
MKNKSGWIGVLSLIAGMLFSAVVAAEPRVSRAVSLPGGTQSASVHVAGRVVAASGNGVAKRSYQWPGLYFESTFEGRSAWFNVGSGDVILQVLVDGKSVSTLVKPAAGLYSIDGLAAGQHTVRVAAVTESQASPNEFGGFVLPGSAKPLPTRKPVRQIEFIGDSHTVGYGNTSATRECTSEEVWATTDNSQAFGPKVARHYGADYQINAISGRGIVRNYNGSPGDTLPAAYPFAIFDHSSRYDGAGWQPQVIVIALGTNDFSTPLNAGERWRTREELHADYEATYVKFVETLRARNPQAFFILWATDLAEGEIQAEVRKVFAKLQAKGEGRIAFVPVDGLTMTGCHWHPSVADDATIAAALTRIIDVHRAEWTAH